MKVNVIYNYGKGICCSMGIWEVWGFELKMDRLTISSVKEEDHV